ncbi:lysoplasmalogenase [Flectobacillus rivi]|uniref:Lysoplasmalogenase n=1 Tax=Flectobacillus rivi TaxID=2984209 RepID=A0ABT6Z5C1_9BACT|nr:lysoplasmalogenase [Flectobacillus rivi]MDI9876333.1 lysoplasmalogenase [Flectobacillus rivi]
MKNLNAQRILILFGIISTLELFFLIFPSENFPIRYFTKPLLLPLLILYDYQNQQDRKSFFSTFRIALAFAWLGDVLLMLPNAFVPGLLAFLMMQILYIRIFWQDCATPQKGFVFRHLWIMLLLVGYHLMIMLPVWPYLGAMQIPVLVYSIVISIMVLAAINRIGEVPNALKVAVGAVLFMVSDSLIAITKFGSDFAYSGFCVMLTYIVAQYLIVKGREIPK